MRSGGIPDRVRSEDAQDLAAIQAHLGHHIPANQWVMDLVTEPQQAKFKSLGPC